jgi:hypothetical protein
MLPRLAAPLWLAACSLSQVYPPPPPAGPAAPADTELPGPAVHTAGALPADAPWRPVWPHPEGSGGVVDEAADGRVLGREGSREAAPGGSCGTLTVLSRGGLLWLPAGPEIAFRPAPVVSAPVVERAAWRLAEALGPPAGVVPGTAEADPAIHRGVRVRAVHKIRRQGPPWQVVVGERGDRVLVALTDREAEGLEGSLHLRRTTRGTEQTLQLVPPADVDGDGHNEVVVAGDGPDGHFRAVIQPDLMTGELVLEGFVERGPVRCAD